MDSSGANFEQLFAEAAQSWDMERLYADLERVNAKSLKPFEKACLRGLLCRYRPGQIAFTFAWTSGALRVELNKGLYRAIEMLTARPLNTLRWDKVGEWLEQSGYRLAAAPANQPLTTDWGDAPEVSTFCGRETELDTLERWMVGDRCRLVSIWGMGGIGKTALGVRLVERIRDRFERCLWRSLRNVQPLEQLLADILRCLGDTSAAAASVSHLLELLRQGRYLVVLDDVETILQEGELAGQYRPGCEGYGELLQRLGSDRHQSGVLIVGREQPREVDLLQGETQPTRSLQLGGLDRLSARELLKTRGFLGTEAGIDSLIDQYRGNPAALRIVSATIRELFDGNIAEFLKQTKLVLSNTLRGLLYEQFERLSACEKDMLYWLALKRRPATLSQLREDMRSLSSGSESIDALRSLRWRSLVEKHVEGGDVWFALEPVVMKYVNHKFVEEVGKELAAIVATQRLGAARLLHSHALVEDNAPEAIRAAQIRLTLRPVKDRLATELAQAHYEVERLRGAIAEYLHRFADVAGYLESNLTLLGILL